MSEWWSGASGNLIANLVTAALVTLFAVRFNALTWLSDWKQVRLIRVDRRTGSDRRMVIAVENRSDDWIPMPIFWTRKAGHEQFAARFMQAAPTDGTRMPVLESQGRVEMMFRDIAIETKVEVQLKSGRGWMISVDVQSRTSYARFHYHHWRSWYWLWRLLFNWRRSYWLAIATRCQIKEMDGEGNLTRMTLWPHSWSQLWVHARVNGCRGRVILSPIWIAIAWRPWTLILSGLAAWFVLGNMTVSR